MDSQFRSRIICICLLCFMVYSLAACGTVRAADYDESQGEKRIVRVGYYLTPGFQEYDAATNTYSGYSYEYLLAIAQYTNWEYEFVPVEFGEGVEKLERGELDLMNNISFLKSREDTLSFSDMPAGRGNMVVAMLPERSNEVGFEEFPKYNDLTIGIVKNRSYTEDFVKYCADNSCTPKIVYFDSTAEARNAWQSGKIDAYVGPSTYNMQYHVIGQFRPEKFYFATPKKEVELQKQLNRAMSRLIADDIYFEQRLYLKYYSNMYQANNIFEESEKEYLSTHPVIKVIYDQAFYPFSYKDEQGEFRGAMRDIYDLISQRTGLEFKFAAAGPDLVEDVGNEDGKDYILAEMPYDYAWAYKLNVNITRPFMEVRCVKVSSRNNENGGKMAIVDGYYLGSLCKELFGDKYTYIEYPSTKACIDAVKNGEVDATCMTAYESNHYSNTSEYRSLIFKIESGLEYRKSIGITKTANPLLKSIMDKSLHSITDEEIKDIIQATVAQMKPDLMTMLYHNPRVAYTFIVIVLMLLMIIVVVMANQYFIKKNKEVIRQKNEQLEEAIEQANFANSSKSRFLAQMSHEIRTPMNAVVGMTAMAHKHVNNPQKTLEYLGKIDVSSKMLLNIINDILDMSAIENNKLKIANEVFDLKKILNGISTVYYAQCKEKGVKFEIKINELEDEILIGDALRVNQVMMNLVSNAFKFTPSGGTIDIEVTEKKRSGDKRAFIKFIVSDSGCGMSENLMGRLFKAFEQESATTAQKHGGSGLGLAITKNLVDMMHGAIEVKSKQGKGTTFIVNIPFEISNDNINPDTDMLGDLYALIVDDDEGVIEYTSEVLGRMGVKYDAALNAEDALEMVKKSIEDNNCYDVCLIDWKLPGMDGLEMVRKVRSMAPDDTILIIISAYDLSEVADEAKAAGANMYLGKPFFQSTLFNALLSAKHHCTGEVREIKDNTDKESIQYDFTGKRVLLAEDFELNREVAMDLFEEVNLVADCAENGKEALEMFVAAEPGTYDIVLMDIQMPEMDGLEATKAIRESEHPEAKTMPIYAMSANAFSEDIAEALNAGMNGHIAKPIDTDALYALLDKVINKKELNK